MKDVRDMRRSDWHRILQENNKEFLRFCSEWREKLLNAD